MIAYLFFDYQIMQKSVYEFISKKTWDPIIEWRICRWTGEKFPIYQGDVEMLEKLSSCLPSSGTPLKKGDNQWELHEKIFSLPLPTLSPLARMRRRMMFRNERGLYKSQSCISGKPLISLYAPESGYKVVNFDESINQVNPEMYGIIYDSNKTFLEQYAQLNMTMPKVAIINLANENGTYDNYSSENKHVYMNADIMWSENVSYSTTIKNVNNGYDLLQVHDSDLVYECVASDHLSKCVYTWYSNNCHDCWFLMTCRNCTNCWFCSNLHNKQHYLFNKPASKEDIDTVKQKMKSYTGLQELFHQFDTFLTQVYRPWTLNMNCEECFGSALKDSKSSFRCYDSYNIENCRYCMVAEHNQDCMDTTIFNPNSSLIYENVCGGISVKNAYSCNAMIESSHMYFCDLCLSCSYMIGCINMHHKQYCIFNKQYKKEERERLAPMVLGQLQREWLWGEFISISQCPFPYNDSVAMDYFPIRDLKILNRWFSPDDLVWWFHKIVDDYVIEEKVLDEWGTWTVYYVETDELITDAILDLWGEEKVKIKRRTRDYEINIPKGVEVIQATNLEDTIDAVDDSILKKVIICTQSGRPYRIMPRELAFYRKIGIALPRIHYALRHTARIKSRPSKEVYLRTCDRSGEKILSLYPSDAWFPVWSQEEFKKEVYG